jgi:flagellar assembly protein FliH
VTPQPRKFTFGTEFGVPDPKRRLAELEAEVARLGAALEGAESRGHAAGYEAGRQDRLAVEAAALADAMSRFAVAAESGVGALVKARDAIEREAVEIALATARALAGGLIARQPTVEIQRLAEEAMRNLRAAPHLALRVAPDLVERVDGEVKRLAASRGFNGRIVVIGDPDAAPGDARIEWADGGLTRERAGIEAAIDAAVAAWFARDDRTSGE